ncbi:ROP binding protein kinases 2 [Artemisia annua]|uniref:non-specific serine/threonine protein kinase n=1 Tax=Artemisia annua TaxID=35608 RepID=A0A2U1N1A2_ARTAN|nr:ROP binding protein kinases 2 [Artemisia annua]
MTMRKKYRHLYDVVKRILQGKSIEAQHKGGGRSLWTSASAQDLRYLDMDKHRDYATSPRDVIEAYVQNSSNVETSRNENVSQPQSRWGKFFKLWKKNFAKRVSSLPPLTPNSSSKKTPSYKDNSDVNLCHKSSWIVFTLTELQAATNNFSKENMIGTGGFANVYKGCLHDGRLVAVKRLNKGTTEEQIVGFLSEIGTIAHVNHPNTATLIGYGIEGGTHLVMELSPHGNLGSVLRGGKEKLDWSARYKIILGMANGLSYLHENCQRRIIHRDIKADNILLMENLEPQICDFGLATWLPKDWTHHRVSKFEGTFGYCAPEYLMHGIVDEKIDVFSYGVLVLELITGHQALDESQKSLVIWHILKLVLKARPLMERNAIWELVDPSLGNDYEQEEMERVILAASLCIELSPLLRPLMSQVVMLLRNNYDPKGSTPQQKKRAFQRTYSEKLMDVQEYD